MLPCSASSHYSPTAPATHIEGASTRWKIFPTTTSWACGRSARSGSPVVARCWRLVEQAEAGYFSSELESLLHVEVKGCLLKLVQQQRVAREKLFGRFLYCSATASRRKLQLAARRVWEAEPALGAPLVEPELMPDELKAAIILFFTVLDEKQRRLYAGLEALKIGHGGDRQVGELLGLDVATVARGRRELLAQDVEVERTRRTGGGRKRLEKKRQK